MDNESSGEENKPLLPSQEAIEKELRTEERYVNYFKSFQPLTVEQFISSYATYKAMWWQSGEWNVKRNENEDLQWINLAHVHLGFIQQKKLFDVQCL